MERRRDDQLIAGKVLGGPRKIHRNIAVMKGVVEKLDMFAEAEMFVRLHWLLQRPIIVVAVEDTSFGLDVGPFDGRSQQLYFVAELGDFLEHAAVRAQRMLQYRAVKFLRAKPRLTPAEKEDGGSPPRHQLV